MSIEIASWVLALFTAGLVWATLRLAKHTAQLARLTNELVHIEQERELRILRERRQAEISKALELVQQLCTISPDSLGREIAENPRGVPLDAWAHIIRDLSLLRGHIKDTECIGHLNYLVSMLDIVQHNTGSIGGNRSEIEKRFSTLQQRLGWSITEWTEEIISSTTTKS